MDAAPLFKRIFLFLAAGLLAATLGRATPGPTLVVDSTNVTITGSSQFANVGVGTSDGSALNFSVSIAYTDLGTYNWLTATAGGNCTSSCPTPGTVSISLSRDLAQYGSGPFKATVTLNPGSVQIQVSYYPGAGGLPDTITVTPSASNANTSVSLAYTTNGTVPFQKVSVTGTTTYDVSVSTLSGGNWLVVSAASGSGLNLVGIPSPQVLTITLDPNVAKLLSTATYQGSVIVTGAGGTATVQIALSVNGGTSGVVTASPGQLTFAYHSNGSISFPPQTIVVSTPANTTYTVSKNQNWIVLSNSSIGAVPGQIPVLVNPSGLAAGTYNGKITITVGALSTDVLVQLLVSDDAVLWARLPGGGGTVIFLTQGSVASPVSQDVLLNSSDTFAQNTLTIDSFPTWVNVSLNGNRLTITPSVSGSDSLVLSGYVVVKATGAANSPIQIPVLALENGGGGVAALVLSQSSLTFLGAVGAPPPPQTFDVVAAGITSFTVSRRTDDGGSWLLVSPSSGFLVTNQTLTVGIDPTGLIPGIYTGAVLLRTTAGVTQSVPVTFQLSAGIGGNVTATPSVLSFSYQIGSAARPDGIAVKVSNAVGGTAGIQYTLSTSPAQSWLQASATVQTTPSSVTISVDPTGLSADVYQGTVTISPTGGAPIGISVKFTVQPPPPIHPSTTALSFSYRSGGDKPATQTVQITGGAFTAQASSDGNWLAVSPGAGAAGSNITVSVDPSGLSSGAHTGNITLAATNGGAGAVVTVTVNVSPPLPTLTRVVNAASYLAGPVAGGEVITAFGTDLGPVNGVTAQFDSAGNISTTLGGVQVLVNGFLAPLIYVSSVQVSAVVPYEVARFGTATVQITYLGQSSNAISLGVATTSPAIFTLNSGGSGPGAHNNDASFSANGPNNPVQKGGYVEFFLTGEGPLKPAGVTGIVNSATGNPSPAVPTLEVTALVDNLPAQATASGIAGVVEGILQVNVQIPANARSGDVPVVILIGGNGTQSGVTVSIQ